MNFRALLFGWLVLLAGSGFGQMTTCQQTFRSGDWKDKPVPKALQGLPHCVAHNNDDETIRPFGFIDPVTGNCFYVEADGRHVAAYAADGELIWRRNPFVDANMKPYLFTKPVILEIGRNRFRELIILFNSSQGGSLDDKTGDFKFGGQD
jgi:hypothetical protein